MTRVVKVGNLSIGGNNPIIIQSMTNTNSADVEATVKQINELEKAGCQLVRMTINNVKAAEAIKEIKKRVNLPLVADIHFDYRLALLAIENGIDKLRINPGNIGSDENVKKVVEAAKEKNIPIRIGVNSGSIEKEILEKYGKQSTVDYKFIDYKRYKNAHTNKNKNLKEILYFVEKEQLWAKIILNHHLITLEISIDY